MTLRDPVAVAALGPVSAATVVWRMRGRLYVTAIVKATFALVPEGRMSPVAPEPIVPDEQADSSGRGLWSAGDLAPYLGQCDVVVTGHAELLPGFSSPAVPALLAVVQGGALRIDRRVTLDGTARVGAARSHVHIDGLGPLSRAWPRRSQLLGALDPRRLRGPELDIPDGLDWSYFQAATADQRIEALRGDEWIALGGMIAQRPKLRTQVPEARGAARLYRREQAAPRAGEPLKLCADTLHIDVDQRRCSVVWRGHAPVDGAELASLRVLAGVELPGRPVVWADPFVGDGAHPAQAAPHARESDEHGVLGETNMLSPADVAKLLAKTGMPFALPRAPGGETARAAPPAVPLPHALRPSEPRGTAEGPLGETAPIGPEAAAKLFASAVTPFEARRASAEGMRPAATPAAALPAGAPRPPGLPTQPGAESDVLGETATLDPAEAANLFGAIATPFEARRAPERAAPRPPPATPLRNPPPRSSEPPAHHGTVDGPLGETLPLGPAETAKLYAAAAVPFEAPRAPFDAAAAVPFDAVAAVPFEAPRAPFDAAPAPPLAPADPSAPPEGLGAQFLAALADPDPPA